MQGGHGITLTRNPMEGTWALKWQCTHATWTKPSYPALLHPTLPPMATLPHLTLHCQPILQKPKLLCPTLPCFHPHCPAMKQVRCHAKICKWQGESWSDLEKKTNTTNLHFGTLKGEVPCMDGLYLISTWRRKMMNFKWQLYVRYDTALMLTPTAGKQQVSFI